MSNDQKCNSSRIKATGNAIKEFNGFYKLNNINELACIDRLRGYYGNQHKDWNLADQQAKAGYALLIGISNASINFTAAYKAEKSEIEFDESILRQSL